MAPPTQPAGRTRGRTEMAAHLLQRAWPSYEFFLLASLSGAVIGLGYILDSQAVLLFAALLAPLLAPWAGLSLAVTTGAGRLFLRALLALLLASALVFLTGLLSGLAARIWLPLPFSNLLLHSRMWWPDLVVLALGAILLIVSYANSESRPVLPSVAVAYELFLPLGAAGLALGSGAPHGFPDGLLIFAIHFAWATLFGVATLAALGFRPQRFAGYALGILSVLAGLAILVAASGLGTAFLAGTPTPTVTASAAPSPAPTLLPTLAPIPSPEPTLPPTATPTLYFPPTQTPTATITPQPTPVYALVRSPLYGGAVVRSSPDGERITVVDNDYLVQVLPEIQEYKGVNWVHIIATVGGRTYDGWILQSVLVTATPVPGW